MKVAKLERTNQQTHDSARLDTPLPLHMPSTPHLALCLSSAFTAFSSVLHSPTPSLPSLAPVFPFFCCVFVVLFFLFLFSLCV